MIFGLKINIYYQSKICYSDKISKPAGSYTKYTGKNGDCKEKSDTSN